jgi:hypothetical protein
VGRDQPLSLPQQSVRRVSSGDRTASSAIVVEVGVAAARMRVGCWQRGVAPDQSRGHLRSHWAEGCEQRDAVVLGTVRPHHIDERSGLHGERALEARRALPHRGGPPTADPLPLLPASSTKRAQRRTCAHGRLIAEPALAIRRHPGGVSGDHQAPERLAHVLRSRGVGHTAGTYGPHARERTPFGHHTIHPVTTHRTRRDRVDCLCTCRGTQCAW